MRRLVCRLRGHSWLILWADGIPGAFPVTRVCARCRRHEGHW